MASGINTAIGYLATLFFRYVIGLGDPFPTILNFLCCFPLAYTFQCKLAFRQKWQLPRMFAYALTAVPNLAMQWILTILIAESLGIPGWLREVMINIIPLPVMFFVIRFIVTPLKNMKKQQD